MLTKVCWSRRGARRYEAGWHGLPTRGLSAMRCHVVATSLVQVGPFGTTVNLHIPIQSTLFLVSSNADLAATITQRGNAVFDAELSRWHGRGRGFIAMAAVKNRSRLRLFHGLFGAHCFLVLIKLCGNVLRFLGFVCKRLHLQARGFGKPCRNKVIQDKL